MTVSFRPQPDTTKTHGIVSWAKMATFSCSVLQLAQSNYRSSLHIHIYVLLLMLYQNRFFTILRETDEKESRGHGHGGGKAGGGGKVAGPAASAAAAVASSRSSSAAGAALESVPGLFAFLIPTDPVPFENF
jgi:hypothetical protein